MPPHTRIRPEAVALHFGRNLAHARREARISLEKLAQRAAMHRTKIGILEHGQRLPRVDTVTKLAGAMAIPQVYQRYPSSSGDCPGAILISLEQLKGRISHGWRPRSTLARRPAALDVVLRSSRLALLRPPSLQGPVTFRAARERFVADAKAGVALNKHRRPNETNAYKDLESALDQVPDAIADRQLVRITRAEYQAMVDARTSGTKKLSSSRISSIVNAIRSLYRWAKDRELASFDPTAEIRLPTNDAKPRDRVATPGEFARLIAAIFEPTPAEQEAGTTRDRDVARKDALPYALAGYGGARHQEIQILDWEHLNLDDGGGELAGDEEGRKPGGSWRLIFFVRPLWDLLIEGWEAQGRPASGKVCPPKAIRKSGLLALNTLQDRIQKRWEEQGATPIGLHEARRTAATWLDHAGVSPKVASEFIGRKTPEYQLGAARITLKTYTHMLPGELERARKLLDVFLVERVAEEDAAAKAAAEAAEPPALAA